MHLISPRRGLVAILLLAGLAPLAAPAATLTVGRGSGDFTTVGAALEAATDGDTIEISAGTYAEGSLETTKALVIRGLGDVVLSGGGMERILRIHSGARVLLENIVFEQGYDGDAGGAIHISGDSDVRIQGCRFVDNHSSYQAGAIHVRHTGTYVEIVDCEFTLNRSDYIGGAVTAILDSEILVLRCVFEENDGGTFGGAVATNEAVVQIQDAFFRANRATDTGAVWFWQSLGGVSGCTFARNESGATASLNIMWSTATVERSIFYSDVEGAGMRVDSSGVSRSCNLYWRNVGGSLAGANLDPTEIVGNPMFCDPRGLDYTVADGSPASPAGNACEVLIGAYDVACRMAVRVGDDTISRLKGRF